ncbi:hypothetical protein J8J27_31790, partial [Mycobacterium tuberculosis]|nr:hypothetical protein [Mycobacterium tuberculosis]
MSAAAESLPAVADAAEDLPKRRSRVMGKLVRSGPALIGGTFVLFFVLVAVLAPLIATHDPLKTSFLAVRKAPSVLNYLG